MDKKLSKYFTVHDLTPTKTGEINEPNETEKQNLSLLANNVLDKIVEMYGRENFIVHSGFRSESVNAKVGGVPTSQHRQGLACDFHIKGKDLDVVFNEIRISGIKYDQLIRETKKGGEWIHVSFSPKKNRRQAMRAVFTNNKMVYSHVG